MFGLYFQVIVHNGGKSGQDLKETEAETVEDSAGWLPHRLTRYLLAPTQAPTLPSGSHTVSHATLWLPCRLTHCWFLIYHLRTTCTADGVAHSGLDLPASINDQDIVPKMRSRENMVWSVPC